jgi:hypothetical protein
VPYSEACVDLQRTLGRPPTRVTDEGDAAVETPDADTPERVDYATHETRWHTVDLAEYVA